MDSWVETDDQSKIEEFETDRYLLSPELYQEFSEDGKGLEKIDCTTTTSKLTPDHSFNNAEGKAYTVCFMGTKNNKKKWEDDDIKVAQKNKKASEKEKETAEKTPSYIPYQIWKDLGGKTSNHDVSLVDGPATKLTHKLKYDMLNINEESELYIGYLQWANQEKGGKLYGPYEAPLPDFKGSSRGYFDLMTGWSMPALAAAGANMALTILEEEKNSDRPLIFIGHSRGGVNCVLAAWFIYLYAKNEKFRKTPISILAIEPVPGPTGKFSRVPNNWEQMYQLPPNVKNYCAVCAYDVHFLLTWKTKKEYVLNPVVPRPYTTNTQLEAQPLHSWKSVPEAFKAQVDPLAASCPLTEDRTYELFVCRGSHGSCGQQKNCPEGVLNYCLVLQKLEMWMANPVTTTPHTSADMMQQLALLEKEHKEFGRAVRSIASGPTTWSRMNKLPKHGWWKTLFRPKRGLDLEMWDPNAGSIQSIQLNDAMQEQNGLKRTGLDVLQDRNEYLEEELEGAEIEIVKLRRKLNRLNWNSPEKTSKERITFRALHTNEYRSGATSEERIVFRPLRTNVSRAGARTPGQSTVPRAPGQQITVPPSRASASRAPVESDTYYC